mmetsp:Transcript_5946/g.8055  ORF Transcript_5946/g.8055 Transcript_5946/m.8055 type:complete len:92 (-) Transcript_5946:2146-2421(-)
MDILPLIKSLYTHYFDMEVTKQKSSAAKSTSELLERSYASCLLFCKEFELMPYMVSQRVCTFVWHSVAHCCRDDPTINARGIIQELSNNSD